MLIVMAAVQAILWWGAWRDLLQDDTPLIVKFRDEFRGAPRLRGESGELTLEGAWRPGGEALWLGPAESGILTLTMPKPRGAGAFVRLWLQGAPEVENLVTFAAVESGEADDSRVSGASGPAAERRYSNHTWNGEIERLDGAFSRAEQIVLTIHAARTGSRKARPLPIIERLEWGYETPLVARVPPLPAILAAALLAVLMLAMAPVAGPVGFTAAALAGAGLMVVIRVSPAAVGTGVLGYAVAAFALAALAMRRPGLAAWFPHRCSNAMGWLSAAAVLWGAALRWDQFIETAGHALDPDARGFLQIIRTMRSPYDTASTIAPWVREPLFPWLGRVWFWIVPDGANALRLMTVVLSIATIWAAWEAGRRMIGEFAGFCAALLLAANDLMIFNAPRGLRTELDVLLALWLAVLFLRLWRGGRRAPMDAAAGQENGPDGAPPCRPCLWKWFALVGALSALARLTALSYVLPMLVLLVAWGRLPIRRALAALAIIIVPVMPHLLFNYYYSAEHDPFFSTSVHARFYRNREFAGQPGFPSAEDVRRDPYGGPPVTSLQYIFVLHRPVEWVWLPLKGLWRIAGPEFALRGAFGGSKVLLGVFLAAMLLTFTQRRYRALGVTILLLAIPVAFVEGVVLLDERLLAYLLPMFYFILAIGLLRGREWIAKIPHSFNP
ncbi:MAG: hypothetical protein Kow0059_15510 [Candidatus Sumerlaeia bacterium]